MASRRLGVDVPTRPDIDSVALRPARRSEAAAVGELMWTVREQSTGPIPPQIHSLEETRVWMRDQFATHEIWVADSAGTLVALMLLRRPDWLSQLYVDQSVTGRGLGSRLLSLAKSRYPEGLQLWTFQSNAGARRFYERHGFTAVAWTDGDNEEGAPDVRYEWRPLAETAAYT
jgi:GNAT superfamily N-acetyltransferase